METEPRETTKVIHILTIVAISMVLIFTISCSPVEQKNNISNNQNEQQDTFSPDTSLNSQLLFHHQPSVEKYLGNLTDLLNEDADLPDSYFQHPAQDSAYLRVVFHPGGTVNTISYLEVGKRELLPDSIELHPMQDLALITENGIRLGMSRKELVAKKGTAYQVTSPSNLISYRVTNGALPFLQRHNMPIYIANYWFEEGSLVKFEFGFEYP